MGHTIPAGWNRRERLVDPHAAGLGRADADALPLRIEAAHDRLVMVQV